MCQVVWSGVRNRVLLDLGPFSLRNSTVLMLHFQE